MKYSELPSNIREAANRGLRDPDDSGAPKTPEEVIEHYQSGKLASQLGKTVLNPNIPSERAMSAPDADEHAVLGGYPDVPGDDYVK